MKYGNRSPVRRVMQSPITLLAVFILSAILTKAAIGVHEKAIVSNQKLSQAEAEYARLSQHQAELNAEVARLSTDEGIEAELRTRYHAVKDGESVAVIVSKDQTAGAGDAGGPPAGTSTATTADADHVGWFGRLIDWLGL